MKRMSIDRCDINLYDAHLNKSDAQTVKAVIQIFTGQSSTHIHANKSELINLVSGLNELIETYPEGKV